MATNWSGAVFFSNMDEHPTMTAPHSTHGT
jgi:hypothetical protein